METSPAPEHEVDILSPELEQPIRDPTLGTPVDVKARR
jgi:hypothetical protein